MGHDRVIQPESTPAYGWFLERARGDFLTRGSVRSAGASRWGVNAAPNLLALSGRSFAVNEQPAPSHSQGGEHAGSGLDGLSLLASRSLNSRALLNLILGETPFWHELRGGKRPKTASLDWRVSFVPQNFLARSAARPLSSLSQAGNRLNLIFSALASGEQLGPAFNLRTRQASFFRELSLITQDTKMPPGLPPLHRFRARTLPIGAANVGQSFFPHFSAERPWLSATAFFATTGAPQHPHPLLLTNRSLEAIPGIGSFLLQKGKLIALARNQQRLSLTSPEPALHSAGHSSLTSDDLSSNFNAAAALEFTHS